MPGILDQRLGEKTEQDIEPTTASPPEPDTNSRSEDYMTEEDIREIDTIPKAVNGFPYYCLYLSGNPYLWFFYYRILL